MLLSFIMVCHVILCLLLLRRETCTAEEFEALVERNMAANCGLDFRVAAEFVGCIAARELHLMRQPAAKRAQRLMHIFNMRRALPVLEGLLAKLDSSQATTEQAYRASKEAASSAAPVESLAFPAACKLSREAANSAAEVGVLAPSDLTNGLSESENCASCSQSQLRSSEMSTLEDKSNFEYASWSESDILQCDSTDEFVHRLQSLVSSMHECLCMQTDLNVSE